MRALVIGSGVIGLTSAITLQEAGFAVRIWTAASLAETCSAVAAAVWYPYRAYPEALVTGWAARSYSVFYALAHEPETGVSLREAVELHREPMPDPWWAVALPSVRRCRPDELPPGYRDGIAVEVPLAETPAFLPYLVERFTSAGGTVERRVAASLAEAAAEAPLVVNCAGIGARGLARDPLVVPIRGQVVRVRNPGLRRCLIDEEQPEALTYVIPRSADCVLGGTAEEGSWETAPDPRAAEAIFRRCVAIEPRLAGAEVLEHRVGLRPGRPAVRLELERIDGARVIHNYGHGGAGITLSWGCAEEVSRLAQEESGAGAPGNRPP